MLDHKTDHNVGPFPINWSIRTTPFPDIKTTKAHRSPNYRFSNEINGVPKSLHPLLHEDRISFCPRQPTVLLPGGDDGNKELRFSYRYEQRQRSALVRLTVLKLGRHHYKVASSERGRYGEACRI
jgi:hypothetical protein